MTLEKIEQHIAEVESKLHHLKLDLEKIKSEQQQPEQPRLERWKPQFGSYYYYLDAKGIYSHTKQSEHFAALHEFFNVFPTSAEAEKEALRTRARRKLEWLARELNKGKEIGSIFWVIAFRDGSCFVSSTEGTWFALGEVLFTHKADAEYALSQMTQKELEALR